ncbi:Protein root UVB sensitive 2, chloroplastic [Porphyridium purpureum]|uniref:Protein root UVB sensitive 2, chloroplastic n=1 Tax=Porphyridium purpureum TaxID=35688 RepID=A0A5J4Z2Y2_PORPP|nr:Protein root UVB sensitive 2, chloroplastic [Porphyridium purpureum]|eukprot:POR5989..scf295_1
MSYDDYSKLRRLVHRLVALLPRNRVVVACTRLLERQIEQNPVGYSVSTVNMCSRVRNSLPRRSRRYAAQTQRRRDLIVMSSGVGFAPPSAIAALSTARRPKDVLKGRSNANALNGWRGSGVSPPLSRSRRWRHENRRIVLVWERDDRSSQDQLLQMQAYAYATTLAVQTGMRVAKYAGRVFDAKRLGACSHDVRVAVVVQKVAGGAELELAVAKLRGQLAAAVHVVVMSDVGRANNVGRPVSSPLSSPPPAAPQPLIPLFASVSTLRLTEYSGNGTFTEFIGSEDASTPLIQGKQQDERELKEQGFDMIKTIYMPDGFPHTVTKDYLAFTQWRTLQNLASSVMAVLSTEALFFGLGVGKKNTAAVAAATAWVLKDGLGYIGKVAYGYLAGKQFDYDPKSWRIGSDLLEDLGGVLELLTPLWPSNFLLLASVANTMKGVASMTGTATRHSIYKSLALRENTGDIATKGESQGVTCKIVGLGAGIGISQLIGQNYAKSLLAYTLFGIVHMAANLRSMKCIQFVTLNRQRSDMLLATFFKGQPLPEPYDISHYEKIIIPPWKLWHSNIELGASVKDAFPNSGALQESLKTYRGEKYMATERNGKIYVILHEDASSDDVLRAWTMAVKRTRDGGSLADAQKYVRNNYARFLKEARAAKWNTDFVLLNPTKARVKW